ncbi:adenosylcobinamide-GDP ribazoletransferase [Actinomycetospora endophytica]|uniref:Adenosylcobinamide-GDP ribazoletransferase n=1 Tax=Actinomycetospora endophytica TaxID=2291215 RepID=A0ABS8PED4_9PSEU|nr:adenosylcobinamide-GDP ribazoletransferase [Actinomycetospora endophytica]MCD2196519.1 adenosylcobinamide-GDP ribazoletransferase [Actinomycetospora endophytica]
MTGPDGGSGRDGGSGPDAGSGRDGGSGSDRGAAGSDPRLPASADRGSWLDAATLALSLFTVVPVRARSTGRLAAARALVLAPVVGLLVGGIVAGVVTGVLALGAPPLLAGIAGVAVAAGLTRGLHLDGLADLADGLGSYGGPERMLAVMKDPSTGAFGVITLIVALGAQAVALPEIVGRGPLGVPAVALAWAAGRASFTWCARRSVPAAAPGGLGALVAGSQPPAVPLGWGVVLAGVAVLVVPGRLWQGPVAIVVAALAAVGLSWHAIRRLGGVNGDVFGGVCEVTVTAAVAVLALG